MSEAQLEDLLRSFKRAAQTWNSVQALRNTQGLRKYFLLAMAAIVGETLRDVASKPGPIVDLGAGLGDLYGLLPLHLRPDYVAVEPSPKFGRALRRDWPNATVLKATGERLPIRDESVNTVIAMNLLDILEPPEPVITELERILAHGGSFIHFHDLRPDPAVFMLELEGIPVPKYEDDQLVGFMLVSKGDFERLTRRLPKQRQAFARFYAHHPEIVELADTESAMKDWLTSISQRLQASNLPYAESPSLIELFRQYCRRKLEAVGLIVDEADERMATVGGPAEVISWYQELPTGNGGPTNLVNKQPDGSWSASCSPEVERLHGPGMLVIQQTMTVTVAHKP